MISNTRLRTLARQDGIAAGLAEKNYVNSWILYAIYQESQLGDHLVFKGGTALSKLYFPQIWRFSEDIDFTATTDNLDVHTVLEAALDDIEAESGIRFEITNVHRAGDPVEFIRLDVQYDAILGQRNTTQIEITFNEKLVFTTTKHQHSYEDIPAFQINAYSIEEILVEKLRSLYQRARARDYYDIYHLLQQKNFNAQEIAEALHKKAEQQEVELDLQHGIPSEDVDDIHNYWDQALDRLVTDKPQFEDVSQTINQHLQKLARE